VLLCYIYIRYFKFFSIIIFVDIISMTTHSPEAQVEVQDEIAKLKTKIEVLEAKIEEYENEYKQATGEERKEILLKVITAKEGRLHDLSDELKALRQQGNEQRTCSFILWFAFPIDSLVVLCSYSIIFVDYSFLTKLTQWLLLYILSLFLTDVATAAAAPG
jgi:hypothetical protein